MEDCPYLMAVLHHHAQIKSIDTIPKFNVMNGFEESGMCCFHNPEDPNPQQQHYLNLKSHNTWVIQVHLF